MLLKFCFLVGTLSFLGAIGQSQSAREGNKSPVSIIFDTDIGPDYDDVGAITLLHAMADSNECKILATVASNRSAILVKKPTVTIVTLRSGSRDRIFRYTATASSASWFD